MGTDVRRHAVPAERAQRSQVRLTTRSSLPTQLKVNAHPPAFVSCDQVSRLPTDWHQAGWSVGFLLP